MPAKRIRFVLLIAAMVPLMATCTSQEPRRTDGEARMSSDYEQRLINFLIEAGE